MNILGMAQRYSLTAAAAPDLLRGSVAWSKSGPAWPRSRNEASCSRFVLGRRVRSEGLQGRIPGWAETVIGLRTSRLAATAPSCMRKRRCKAKRVLLATHSYSARYRSFSAHEPAQVTLHAGDSFLQGPLPSFQFSNLGQFPFNVLICDIEGFWL